MGELEETLRIINARGWNLYKAGPKATYEAVKRQEPAIKIEVPSSYVILPNQEGFESLDEAVEYMKEHELHPHLNFGEVGFILLKINFLKEHVLITGASDDLNVGYLNLNSHLEKYLSEFKKQE